MINVRQISLTMCLSAQLVACGAHRYYSGESNASNKPMVLPTFSSIMSQILEPKCLNCHGETPQDGTVSLHTYELVQPHFVAFDPDNSHLYHHLVTGDMPKGGPSLTSGEIQAVYEWIKSGGEQ